MKSLLNYMLEHGSRFVRRLCGLVWGVLGLGCLFAAYQSWKYLSQPQVFTLGKGIETLMMGIMILFGILFLLYMVVQFTREKDNALARLFQKKVPNIILIVFDYTVLIFILCFFTIGEISLKAKYAIPLQISGAVLLILDLSTNLGLFPDQWEQSPLIRRILRAGKKK